MSVEWNETKAIFKEVEQLFSRDDDVNDVEDIVNMQKEIAEHCHQRISDVRDIIKGWNIVGCYLL
jgi:hypothetical protein